MLEIYFREDNPSFSLDVVEDVEYEFGKINLVDTAEVRELIHVIEEGQYVDGLRFIDRFGMTLPIKSMSTGCKAAILVSLEPDKVINLIECGTNVFSAIVENIRNGRILAYEPTVSIAYREENNHKIRCKVDNYIFTSIDRLNNYILDERPYKPDLSIPGIEEV